MAHLRDKTVPRLAIPTVLSGDDCVSHRPRSCQRCPRAANPIERFPRGPVFLLPEVRSVHRRRSPRALRTLLADTPVGRELCRCWKEWGGTQVKKYEWNIDPEDADHPTDCAGPAFRPTGLRGRPDRQRYRNVPAERRVLPGSNQGRSRRPEVFSGLWATPKSRTRPRTRSQLYDRCPWLGLQKLLAAVADF